MEPNKRIRSIIKLALYDDMGRGDVTTKTLIKDNRIKRAHIIAREKGVLCGSNMVRAIFKLVDESVVIKMRKRDGDKLKVDDRVCTIRGPIHSILKAERVVLNYVSYLSGISTMTNKYVQKIKGTHAKIYDTRKTTPGYRLLEKYAVITGGGYNQRIGLHDQVLIKDNHYQALGKRKLRGVASLIRNVRNKIPRGMKIQVEVDSLALLQHILPARPDMILLDNMRPRMLKRAIKIVRAENERTERHMKIEASGGITLQNVRQIARLGVDRISVGAITHSAHNLDFSLEVV